MREAVTRHDARARLRDLVAVSRAGDRLPSERQLSARWGAARMTIRRAADVLVSEGLVQRRHGSGTYVAPQPFARLLGLTSFTQDMVDRGLRPGSRLLEFESAPPDDEVARQLDAELSEQVLRFTRLRLADDQPMAVETVWIRALLVPGLGPSDLRGSLHKRLAERYGLVPGSAAITIQPVVTDAATRELLEIGEATACLRLEMVYRDARGQAIMLASCLYRGDRYQLSAEISGMAFRQRSRASAR